MSAHGKHTKTDASVGKTGASEGFKNEDFQEDAGIDDAQICEAEVIEPEAVEQEGEASVANGVGAAQDNSEPASNVEVMGSNNIEESSDAAGEAGSSEDESESVPEKLLEAAQAQAAEMKDKYARLQAEWDNFRKRMNAQRDSERMLAAEKLVGDILPVLDDLERAVAHAKESGEGGSLTDGVEAVYAKLLQILGKHNVSQIDALGKPFDTACHQAVGTKEDSTVPEESVAEVYQQGYKMADKVIRPAMVLTSTGGPAQPTEPAEEVDSQGKTFKAKQDQFCLKDT